MTRRDKNKADATVTSYLPMEDPTCVSDVGGGGNWRKKKEEECPFRERSQ